MLEAIFRVVLIGVLTMAFNVHGCVNKDVPGTSVVTGRVVLDGQPSAGGTILFEPKDGVGQAISAKLMKDGRFEARVPQGEKRVKISCPKVIGQKKVYETSDSPVTDVFEELVPERYNSKSQLVISVGVEKSVFDFDLKVDKK